MGARSLNKVQLIGNLTRDPELRYTPNGTAVCSVGLATNRSWTTETGEKREETEFHRIVSWNKLAELCSQLLAKGRKVYVEGRLSTRTWTGQDGAQRTTTEIVIDDMILLDSRRPVEGAAVAEEPQPAAKPEQEQEKEKTAEAQEKPEKEEKKSRRAGKSPKQGAKEESGVTTDKESEEISPDDIPF